ncbi:MAG: VWA domain-containing protein [Planctomycetes bacterium]|nr:VWA domain-containing protein [Planctomycetota bacterium]
MPQQITYELRRGDRSIAAGRRTVPAGLTRLTFRDAVDEPSTAVYSLHVQGDGLDPVPENNTARLLVGVEGPKPMILVTEKTESGLARLLRAGGLDVQAIKPDEAKWELEDLSSYSSVMIEDVPAGRIGLAGMNNLAAWVKDTGAGLMLSGGQTSYGPGGYFKSPLDPIMPVSMELRREHRKLSIAIVIAMDRSGSMAMTVPGGRTKMDLADLAAVQVVDMLTPMDELGVLAVDSESHEISPLAPLSDPQAVRNRILRIESMGGGIYIYEALSHAADLLQKAQAGTKHIILFADAADSEEPGKYEELLAYARKAGMTCSVIGLGTPHDSDADLLRDIARRGDGRIFFTENPEELPRLFAQDTFVVARSSFIEDPTPIKLTPGLTTLTGVIYSDAPPNIGGYNLTYLRDGANLSVVTTDEYAAPVVASWNAGDGRVLCYTGQIDGKFTGPITKWLKLGDTLTGLARWTAGESRGLGDNMLLTQQVHEGIATVSLHLDPQRTTNALAHLPEVTILRGTAGEKPRADRTNMTWTSPDTLSVDFDLRGRETAIATVNLADHPPIAMPPVTLPYSPEFKPAGTDRGAAALRRLAAATGGVERVDLGGIWDDLPRLPRLVDLSPYIFSAALGIFLLEILERRTGAIALLLTRRPRHRVVMKDEPEPAAKARPMRPRRVAAESVVQAKPQTPADSSAAAAPAPPPVEPEPTGSVLDALGQARRRARDRTDRSE